MLYLKFTLGLKTTKTPEQKTNSGGEAYLHSNLVQEELDLQKQMKRTTVETVSYLQRSTTLAPKTKMTQKSSPLTPIPSTPSSTSSSSSPSMTTTTATAATTKTTTMTTTLPSLTSLRTTETDTVTTQVPNIVHYSSTTHRQSQISTYTKQVVVPEFKSVHPTPAVSVPQFIIQPITDNSVARQAVIPNAIPLPQAPVNTVDRLPAENAIIANTNPAAVPAMDGSQNHDDTLGCAWDIVTNTCKDLFGLGWCAQCYDFGNIFLHNCKCLTKNPSQLVSAFTF